MTTRFDPRNYAQELEAAGVPPDQARVHASALSAILQSSAASPGDLLATESQLAHEIEATGQALTSKIEAADQAFTDKIEASELRTDAKLTRMQGELNLLKWMAATNIAVSITPLFKVFSN